MTTKETVLDILESITGSDEVKEVLDMDLYDEGILDSLGTVQLLVELENQLDVTVPVSEFDRSDWGTPQQIIDQVVSLQG
ncbi:D-alanine--poly(phosphoribitol) ligase subunit DltC [Vagococcus elongatus]|uniref:D-alanyl carrier protein n=1 Tax=Vagococcus elongatus TaxID=180344 RepID=A0A430ANK1_9ENTE|nr:D-alanine--poly(phosphoribitol) ligase subunit DltC [Vagococcus elongatus]RSU09702.1 D-alanine--poly(phosphoribitol) ligase subunit 2 [Vagococcus elongatus]